MTKETFKIIDISLFSIIAIILEVVIYCAYGVYNYYLPVYVSFSILLSLISIYRWGLSGTIVAVLGGIAGAAMQNFFETESPFLFIIYGLGNAAVAFSYLLLKKPGRKKISSSTLMLVLYELTGYVAVILARTLLVVILNKDLQSFTSYLTVYIAPDSLGFILGIIILVIANKPNGVLVEMNQYIIDVHEEMNNDKLHLKKIKESNSYDAIGDVTTKGKINDANLLDGGNLDEKQLKELQDMYDRALVEQNKDSERTDLSDGKGN